MKAAKRILMRRVFKNDEQEFFFRQNGYIKLPFDRAAELDACKQKIFSLNPSDKFQAFQKSKLHPQDFHCTFFDSDMDYRKSVFDIVTDFFSPLNYLLLDNYKFIQGNVFIKPPFKGYVAPHQNLTVVDESRFTSLSFWCPAQNTTKENGTMVLVPSSHRKFMKYRSTNISWPLLPMFKDYDSAHLKTIDVAKGEILIIDDSIIHGTTNNITNTERFVFHAMLAPQEAPIIYCNVNKEQHDVQLFNVPDTFWQYYIPGDTPAQLNLWETRPYNERELTENEFITELQAANS